MRFWRVSTEHRSETARSGRRRLPLKALILALAWSGLVLVADTNVARGTASDPIDVRFGSHGGFWRLAIEWAQSAPATVRVDGDIVRIEPLSAAVDAALIQSRLSAVLRHATHEAGGLNLHLRPGFGAQRLEGVRAGVLAIDFRRASAGKPRINQALASGATLSRLVPERRPSRAMTISPRPGGPSPAHEPTRSAVGRPPSPAAEPAHGATTGITAADGVGIDRPRAWSQDAAPASTRSSPDRHRPPLDTLPPLPEPLSGTAAVGAATTLPERLHEIEPATAATLPSVAHDPGGHAVEAHLVAATGRASGSSSDQADDPNVTTAPASSSAAGAAPSRPMPAVLEAAAGPPSARHGRAVRVPLAPPPGSTPVEHAGAPKASSSPPVGGETASARPPLALSVPAPAAAEPTALDTGVHGEGSADPTRARAHHETADDEAAGAEQVASAAVSEPLTFSFRAPVAAAAWRRGDELWVLFETSEQPRIEGTQLVAGIADVAHATARVWRLQLPAVPAMAMARDGAVWRLEAIPSRTSPASATNAPTGDLLAQAIALDDPWLGATMHVIPTLDADGRHHAGGREGHRAWLPTVVGFAFHDLAEPAQAAIGVAVTPAFGPVLPLPERGPLIGLAGASLAPDAARDRRHALEMSLFADRVAARRLALARFLLGEAAPYDAQAVLAAAAPADIADDADRARFEALDGVAAILAGRFAIAERKLPPAEPDAAAEVWLWHAMLAGAQADWPRAGGAFARSGQVWRDYPLPLRRKVAAYAARAALMLDAPQVALAVLHQIEPTAGPSTRADDELTLLRAAAEHDNGKSDKARQRLQLLAQGAGDPETRREARLALTRMRFETHDIDARSALAVIEPDHVDWFGRAGSPNYWRFIAELRAATGDARGAFAAWDRIHGHAFGAERTTLLGAVVEGKPPFDDSLEDAVVLVEEYGSSLPPGLERATVLRELAARVAAETDALHIADGLYRQVLEEPLPHAVAVDVELELAALRLERRLPSAALRGLSGLTGDEDPRIEDLRRSAHAMRDGKGLEAAGETEPGLPTSAADRSATLRAVDDALRETGALLDGGS